CRLPTRPAPRGTRRAAEGGPAAHDDLGLTLPAQADLLVKHPRAQLAWDQENALLLEPPLQLGRDHSSHGPGSPVDRDDTRGMEPIELARQLVHDLVGGGVISLPPVAEPAADRGEEDQEPELLEAQQASQEERAVRLGLEHTPEGRRVLLLDQ